jgi:hypothetical protein
MVRFVLLAGTFAATHAVVRSGHTHTSGVIKQAEAVEKNMKRFVQGKIDEAKLPDTETLSEIAEDMEVIADNVVEVDHARTQTELDNARDSVHACNTAWEDYNADGLPTKWATVKAKLDEHNECRRKLHEECYPAQKETCDAKERYKDQVIHAFKNNCAQDTCGKTSGFTDEEKNSCTQCLTSANGLYNQYYGTVDPPTGLVGEMTKCSLQTNTCADDDDDCDAVQRDYNDKFCLFVDEVELHLGRLDDCYAEEAEDFEEQKTIAETEETSNKNVFISAFKINCFSDVIREISQNSTQGNTMSGFNLMEKVKGCLNKVPTPTETLKNGKYTLNDLNVNYTSPHAKLQPTPDYITEEADQFYDDAVEYNGIVGYTSGGRELVPTVKCTR